MEEESPNRKRKADETEETPPDSQTPSTSNETATTPASSNSNFNINLNPPLHLSVSQVPFPPFSSSSQQTAPFNRNVLQAPTGKYAYPTSNAGAKQAQAQKNARIVMRRALMASDAESSVDYTPAYSTTAAQLLRADNNNNNNNNAFEQLKAFCESPALVGFCGGEGFEKPRFTVNPHATPGNQVYDSFFAALGELLQQQQLPTTTTTLDKKDEDAVRIEIVFHGTKQANLEGILQNGLDPSRRKGQAYGTGEYFSRRPHTSLTYCNRGTDMLVFAVVVPDDCKMAPKEEAKPITRPKTQDKEEDSSDEFDIDYAEMKLKIPHSYVVVPTVAHQLPLGILSWDSTSAGALEKSMKMRLKLKALTEHVKQKQRAAEEASLKAGIIQLLIKKYIDTAGNRYEKVRGKLSALSLKEISMFAHRLFDVEVVEFYFPGLPSPMSSAEHDETKIRSVEETERDLSTAQKNLEDAQKQMAADEDNAASSSSPS